MRQPGYYWVKENDSNHWIICQYSATSDRWVKCGDDGWMDDTYFSQIDERRIEREPSVDEKNAANDIKPPTDEWCREIIERTCRDDGGPAFNYP